MRIRNIEDVLKYARKRADELEEDMVWERSERGMSGGWWKAKSPEAFSKIDARAAGTLEFFSQYTGADSFWTKRAEATYLNDGNNQSLESGVRALGDLLREWANQVESGIAEIVGSRALAEASIVSTDIMSQVRRLLEDRDSHPAAAIVLCGAALETALRALADARTVPQPPKPSLSKLTTALRSASILTAQDVKDLEQCGGIRNSAAHGEFKDLTHERAGLMEQQTNLLLRKLADLHP